MKGLIPIRITLNPGTHTRLLEEVNRRKLKQDVRINASYIVDELLRRELPSAERCEDEVRESHPPSTSRPSLAPVADRTVARGDGRDDEPEFDPNGRPMQAPQPDLALRDKMRPLRDKRQALRGAIAMWEDPQRREAEMEKRGLNNEEADMEYADAVASLEDVMEELKTLDPPRFDADGVEHF
jgi:hypothetical protein